MSNVDEALRAERLKNAVDNYEFLFKEGVNSVPQEWVSEMALPELYNAIQGKANVFTNGIAPFHYAITLISENQAIVNENSGNANLLLSKDNWELIKAKIDDFYANNDVQSQLEDLFINNMDKIRGANNE